MRIIKAQAQRKAELHGWKRTSHTEVIDSPTSPPHNKHKELWTHLLGGVQSSFFVDICPPQQLSNFRVIL